VLTDGRKETQVKRDLRQFHSIHLADIMNGRVCKYDMSEGLFELMTGFERSIAIVDFTEFLKVDFMSF